MNFTLPVSISFLYPAYLALLALAPLFLALGWPGRQLADRRQRQWSLAIRLLILLGLVFGLAGAQLERPVDTITTVFLLDVSDSVSATERARAEAFLRQALADKPAGDRAAVVMFGGDALVEQLPRAETAMPALTSVPIKNATNIEQAVRLALALLPGEGGSRLVLLSDGQETEGQVRRMVDLAAARQVEISVYPLGRPAGAADTTEVLVERVSAPGQARQGQTVPVDVVVLASRPVEATLRLLADGTLVESQAVRLVTGRNRFSFSLPAGDTSEVGFRRFRVEVEPAADGRVQNNWGAAFTTVYGPPHLLVVTGQPAEATGLLAALASAGLAATSVDPAALPGNLPDLAGYDAIILANVPATALPEATQLTLASFVRDLGRGLVMIGGPQSYGAGGYLRSPLETALPVNMEVRNRSQEPNIALVLAIDKSGSMGGCHCDNPDLRQTYTRAPNGLPKIDIAKEAIFQAAQVLGDLDYMGVVSFDASAHWQLKTGPWTNPTALEEAIGGITANGQTNIYAGLAEAEASLVATPARIKHIILLTDGWSRAGAYEDLTTRLAEEGITLSVVAAGNGSAEYLADLARRGGGQYYPAPSMSDVPQIFLKETVRAVGHYIIEEPFVPVPVVAGPSRQDAMLSGLDLAAAPPLLGYNGTTAKETARTVLLTPRGDPLLATWQYGLGRAVAWTSDFSGRWAQEWLAWEGLPRLVGQVVTWSLPRPGDDRLEVAADVTGSQVALTANVQDQAGQPQSFLAVTAQLLGTGGKTIEADMVPSGPGRYQAVVPLPDQGVYLAQVTARQPAEGTGTDGGTVPVASQTTGLVVPYSPEYASLAADMTLLADLAAATGGQTLTEPAQAFNHTLAAGRQTQALWPGLLLLAALLFPVDVAVRRLRLGRREWRQARAWLAQRLPGPFGLRPAPSGPAGAPASFSLSAFRQARERVQQRRPAARPVPPGQANPTPPAMGQAGSLPPAPPAAPPATASPPSEEGPPDTLGRLRAAKKRAQR